MPAGSKPFIQFEGMEELRGKIQAIRERFISEDFYKDSHRKIFQVLVELYAGGGSTDPVVVAEELKRRGLLESVGDRAYIYSLVGTTPNPRNCRQYAEIVQDASIRRRLIDIGYDITNMGYTTGEEVYESYVVHGRLKATIAQANVGNSATVTAWFRV